MAVLRLASSEFEAMPDCYEGQCLVRDMITVALEDTVEGSLNWSDWNSRPGMVGIGV